MGKEEIVETRNEKVSCTNATATKMDVVIIRSSREKEPVGDIYIYILFIHIL